MVCLACLLPLFLVPIVNFLPLLFDLIVARIYRLFGWEYRKPRRTPQACSYKPVSKNNGKVTAEDKPGPSASGKEPMEVKEEAEEQKPMEPAQKPLHIDDKLE